jgi:enoyl-CoA hydratase/carnithine racemase
MTTTPLDDPQEGITFLSLRGRGRLNLLGRSSFVALTEDLDRVRGDGQARVVVLSGAGETAFSAGVDLNEMKELQPEGAESFIRALHQATRGLLTLPVPAIAAVRGPCLGGALELALCCDLRIVAEDALLGLPEVKVGVPSVIEASLLPRTIGLGRARAMVLTGESVTAQEALQMGLVDQVVPVDQLQQVAVTAARGFLGMSANALSVQKEVVVKWLDLGEEAAAEYSIKAFAGCFATPDPREAMTAFLEKRAPRFQ